MGGRGASHPSVVFSGVDGGHRPVSGVWGAVRPHFDIAFGGGPLSGKGALVHFFPLLLR